MDPWEIFSELYRRVATEGNVYLDVFVTKVGIEMMLMPFNDWEEEEDET